MKRTADSRLRPETCMVLFMGLCFSLNGDLEATDVHVQLTHTSTHPPYEREISVPSIKLF